MFIRSDPSAGSTQVDWNVPWIAVFIQFVPGCVEKVVSGIHDHVVTSFVGIRAAGPRNSSTPSCFSVREIETGSNATRSLWPLLRRGGAQEVGDPVVVKLNEAAPLVVLEDQQLEGVRIQKVNVRLGSGHGSLRPRYGRLVPSIHALWEYLISFLRDEMGPARLHA